jgi:hypothetical protein
MELTGSSSQTQTYPIWLDSTLNESAPIEFDFAHFDDFLNSITTNFNEINETATATTTTATATSLVSINNDNNEASSIQNKGNKDLENTLLLQPFDDWNGEELLLDFDASVIVNENTREVDMEATSTTNAIDQIDSPSAEITYDMLDFNLLSAADKGPLQVYDESSSMTNMSLSYSPASAAVDVGCLSSSFKRVRRTIDKKESNKAAAERYRLKKMREKEMLFSECELYAKKNVDLKRKISDIQTEISFIKSLLVEALIAKTSSS